MDERSKSTKREKLSMFHTDFGAENQQELNRTWAQTLVFLICQPANLE